MPSDLEREGAGQQVARALLAEAARAQVEERVGVELPDARAVAALHVVGVDLELGLGVHLCARAEQQVGIRLVRVRLLGVRDARSPAAEHALRASAEDPLVELAARAVGHGVVDQRVVVDELLVAAADEEARSWCTRRPRRQQGSGSLRTSAPPRVSVCGREWASRS